MPVRLEMFHYVHSLDAAVLNSQRLRRLYAQSNKLIEARLIISRNCSAPVYAASLYCYI
jgi:hypothetical protein